MQAFKIRANVGSIILNLFRINPQRNSNESVLVGILGLYTGSVGPADRLLMEVLNQIDIERSLNILSSSEIWNAFRNNWSRSNLESVSCSLQSPFALIDSGAMQLAILDFNVAVGNKEIEMAIDESKNEDIQKLYATYDPSFWLPIIAYCLRQIVHSSELTVLIENSSVGYALVCLSAKQESIRKMAAYVLVNWEHLCGVCNPFEI